MRAGALGFSTSRTVVHTTKDGTVMPGTTAAADELLAIGSWTKAKELGKIRVEGKDYVVADGDVIEFRFNV